MPIVASHASNRPIWFDVMTSDADAARKFYSALFGWTFNVGGPETGFYSMAQLNGKNAAGLGPNPPEQPMPPAWTAYFGVVDADATCAKITAAGGQVMVPVMDIMEFGRMAVCVDPTGAVFGLWQPMLHKGAEVIEEPGAMAWSEVVTSDADKAAAFYGEVFGLESKRMEDPTTEKYYTLDQSSGPVCGVMQMTSEMSAMPPHWMVYFGVADIAKAQQVITDHGGSVVHGPFDSPYGSICVITDPQGAWLSIIEATQR